MANQHVFITCKEIKRYMYTSMANISSLEKDLDELYFILELNKHMTIYTV